MANRSFGDDYEPIRKKSAPRPARPGGASARTGAKNAARSGSARASGTRSSAGRPGGQRSAQNAAAPRKRPATAYTDYGARRPVKRRKKRANPFAVLLYWLIAVALAFAISFFVRAYVFELVRVNGDAMYETMMNGDLALVTKFDFKEAEPVRGDLIAVRVDGGNGVVLRRVIALPGETVEIREGVTYIDGREMLESYVGLRNYNNYPGKTLPPGYYYILSDNRTEEYDSRNDAISLVTKEDFVGKVRMLVWPLSHLATF